MPFENLNTQVGEMSDEDLEILAGTAGDDKGKGKDKGKTTDETKPEGDEKTKGKSTSKSGKDSSATPLDRTVNELSEAELEELVSDEDEEDEEDDKDDEDKNEDKTKGKKDKDKGKTDKEAGDEGIDGKDKEDEEGKKGESKEVTAELVENFLKERANLLIKSGKWADFEGREDFKWTEEAWEEMELQQDSHREAAMHDKLLDKFGPYGRQIAQYAENGGDPDKLIDIFQAQQEVSVLSIATEEDQKEVVFKHQTEFLGQSKDRANRYIKSLIADKELEAEAKDNKEFMEKALKQQLIDLDQEQKDEIEKEKLQVKATQERFSSEVVSYLNNDKEIPAEEKKEIIKLLTKFDKKGAAGTPVNEFYHKFAAFKKNLPNYINLVRMVNDPKKFFKSVKSDGKSEASEKAFKLVRTANSSKKSKSVAPEGSQKQEKKSGFKLLY